MMHARTLSWSFALLVALAGCGSDSLSGAGGPCDTAQDCRDQLVCDPATNTCSDSLGCVTHGDCGQAAYCDADGMCQPNDPGGPCDTSNDCVSGEMCSNGTCVPGSSADGGNGGDGGCGGELYSADNVPPNVLIVLDRTGSMNQSVGGGGGTKWNVARSALYQLLTDYGNEILFGLMLFPGTQVDCESGTSCTIPGGVQQDPAAGTASAISSTLMNATTCSLSTPIALTLDTLPPYAGLEDTTRPNYVLLVTDGMEECGGDPVASVTALRNESPEVKTFVIGFGGGVDANQLNAMATAGGTAKPGNPMYYQADNANDLQAALATIAGSVLSCTYTLSGTPPNDDELYAFFDSVEVPRDTTHNDGWDYDAASNTVTFYGNACNQLQSGQVGDLQIVFGCPDVIIN